MGPLPLWADQRWEAEVLPAVLETANHEAEPSSRSCLGRLGWLLQARPDIRERTRLLLPVKDFLRQMLTGVAATDIHEAEGTGLTVPGGHEWSTETLDRLGLAPRMLPPILSPSSLVGSVSELAAEITGLRAGTPVVVGTTDWHAALLGSCAALPGRASLYLGTAGVVGGYSSRDDLDRLDAAKCLGAVSSTGSAVQWLARLLFGRGSGRDGRAVGAAARLAAESTLGARGLIFLPHLFGERGGEVRPSATGTLAGLRLTHGRDDMARAVLEGTAMWLHSVTAQSMAPEAIESIIVSGGGAREPLNSVIAAALYRRPVLIPEVVEAGALGTALLAAVGTGLVHGCADTATAWVRVKTIVDPDPDLAEAYAELYERFLRTEAVLRTLETPLERGPLHGPSPAGL
jgi:sugar (pentulose or hexulose) kinase